MSWADIRKIIAAENNCFVLSGDQLEKITAFSEYTNRAYTLMPTPRAPTLLISGLPMHRIKDTTPDKDTLEKVKAIKPLLGRVLDTSTGLGYTAVQAARTADEVITIELDPAVLEIGRLNPWSRELFDNPKISQRIGDSVEVVEELEDDSFNHVIHDPPTISLAGHLYGFDFYRELHRIIKKWWALVPLHRGPGQPLREASHTRRRSAFGGCRFQPNTAPQEGVRRGGIQEQLNAI